MSSPQVAPKLRKRPIPPETRVLFVGDRVCFLVSIAIAITILLQAVFLVTSATYASASGIFTTFGVIGFACIILLFLTYEESYWSTHLLANPNMLLSLGTWVGLTTWITGLCEPSYGITYILEATLTFLAMYATGYALGREFWRRWDMWSPMQRGVLMTIIITAFLAPLLYIGITQILSGNIHIGFLILVYGVGSLGAAGLKAFMLHCFLDLSGIDVIADPPAKIAFIGAQLSFLFDFIAWVLLIFMLPIPPVAGSKDSAKSSSRKKQAAPSSGAAPHHHHFYGYRRYRYVLAGSPVIPKEHYPADVRACWEAVMGPHRIAGEVPFEDST